MQFSLSKSLEILARTPGTLSGLCLNLSEEWVCTHEGKGTWSVYDIVGHLVHTEQTNWVKRVELILSDTGDKTFKPLDRFAQLETSKGKSLVDLLSAFRRYRQASLECLRSLGISEDMYARTGMHPALGQVTLQEVIATWTVHDLNHLAQVARVMAKQYKAEVGPFREYLPLLG